MPVLTLLFAGALIQFGNGQQRPKDKDSKGVAFIPLSKIPVGDEACTSDSYYGYGIVKGSLEKCDMFLESQQGETSVEYENFKCRALRVNGEMVDGKCACKRKWKGPICNELDGCPTGYSFYRGSCNPDGGCLHNGTIAIGSQSIECSCPAPWDGKHCERLACFRMASQEHQKRWRNARDHCECAKQYTGENCDQIIACKNGGELVERRCVCKEPFYGEICENKCAVGQTCASGALVISFIAVFSLLLFSISR
ncbi:hypothetical protein AB6A40_008368 [Gnathostoma spinigerum]|uniref:EGF-like domain-containing protein n=1 Tax=Gnathostoma spinigerum TaxID=75299 RepID=A0ABD6ENV9_9BILA